MRKTAQHFLTQRGGATAIEYGLLCAMIGLLMIAAVGTTGQKLVAALSSLLAYF